MATQSNENKDRAANGGEQKPPTFSPSEVNSMVGRVVSIVENAPEGIQRRVLEGARIALGLSNAQPQRQPNNNGQQQKR